MAQQHSDNFNINAPKQLDDKSGVYDGVPLKWRPFNNVAEFIAKVAPIFRYETQSFWVRNPTNPNGADLWVLDKQLTPYLFEETIDLTNYYTKAEIDDIVDTINTNVSDIASDLQDHVTDTGNPHNVTKAQVGLSNVDNTSDLNKPLSNAAIAALALKQDKEDQTLVTQNKTIVGAINELDAEVESLEDNVALNSVHTSAIIQNPGNNYVDIPEVGDGTIITILRGVTPYSINDPAVSWDSENRRLSFPGIGNLEPGEGVSVTYSGTGATNVDFSIFAKKDDGPFSPPIISDGGTFKINDFEGVVYEGVFAGDKFIFFPALPAYGQILGDGYVNKFLVKVVNAEVGRTVSFFIKNPDTGLYKYVSPPQPCPDAGVLEFFPDNSDDDEAAKVSEGDLIGGMVDFVNAANGMAAHQTGGPMTELFYYYNAAGGIPAKGSSSAFTGNFTQFRFAVSAEVSTLPSLNNPIMRYQQMDQLGGAPIIDRTTGKINPDFYISGYFPHKDKMILANGNSIDEFGRPAGAITNLIADKLMADVQNNAVASTGMWFNNTPSTKINLTGTIAELEALQVGNGVLSYENLVLPFIEDTDIWLLRHFINDAMRFVGASAGAPGTLDRSTIWGAWEYLIMQVYAIKPDIKIVIFSQAVRFDNLANPGNPFDVARIDAGITTFKAIAKYFNIPFCNTAELSGFNNFTKATFTADNLHQKLIYNEWLASLEAAFINANI